MDVAIVNNIHNKLFFTGISKKYMYDYEPNDIINIPSIC